MLGHSVFLFSFSIANTFPYHGFSAIVALYPIRDLHTLVQNITVTYWIGKLKKTATPTTPREEMGPAVSSTVGDSIFLRGLHQ